MRDWSRYDGYLNKILEDVYPQPEDKGHTELARRVIYHWMSRLPSCKSVLDLGCGTGFCQEFFERFNVSYEGVCLGDDYLVASEKQKNVKMMDFSFLDYPDESFDLLFSRHSLEHSPFPLMTLMEWQRVSKQWLGLVVPAVEWYGYFGKNHYYVLHPDQWKNLLDRAGWKIIWHEVAELWKDEKDPGSSTPHEYWMFCEKVR